jgi:hypothetical protein
MTSQILKVSVLASGAVSLDGKPVTVEELQAKLESVKADRPVVWYYREAAGGEPPAEAMHVMKVVVDNRLPVSLCSKPDFSDYVDLKGVAHLRHATWDSVVSEVRERTAGGRYVGLVRPDRTYLLIAPPRKDSMPQQMIQMMEKLVPAQPQRDLGAIADTYFTWKAGRGIPTLAETAQEIPFFGMLLGLACIGHSVCVFPGTGDSLTPGCKGTDLLIVDEAQIPVLADDWKMEAALAMRNQNILIHERSSFKLTRA